MSGKECVRLEHEVQKQCLDWLQANGIYCWRNNTGCCKVGNRFIRYGYKGSSDIIGICPDGRFLAVEVKRSKGGVLSDEQKIFLNSVKRNGGVAFVVNSLESLENQLEENSVKTLQKLLKK